MRFTLVLVLVTVGCDVVGTGTASGDEHPADSGPDGPPEAPMVDCDAIFQRPGHGETFYEDNPTYADEREIDWRLTSPGGVGIDAGALQAASDRLAQSPALLSLLVIRDGALAYERYENGSAPSDSNNVHSASKSILGSLAGIAVADGLLELETPVADLLPNYAPDPRIEVGHLLTMSAGFEWTEDDTEYTIETRPDWIAAILGAPMVSVPGVDFNYSSGASHVMSAVLEQVTGQSTCAFAHDRLLRPLGITAEHWGRDPTGVYSGGYNLYMTPRELARYGQLIASGGSFGGRQLVDADWVERSIAPQLLADGDYSYGTLFWLRSLAGEQIAIAWGYGGQFVYIVPALALVVVMTADTATDHPELDGESFLADLIAATER